MAIRFFLGINICRKEVIVKRTSQGQENRNTQEAELGILRPSWSKLHDSPPGLADKFCFLKTEPGVPSSPSLPPNAELRRQHGRLTRCKDNRKAVRDPDPSSASTV